MPRPKTFDPDEALQKAMTLFWVKGFAATSMADLEAHLSLGRISLYGAFGSKKQLFLKCLEKYRCDVTAPLLQKLDDKNGLAGIQNFFDAVLTLPPDLRRRGCLIVNTMVAADEPDKDIDAVIQDHVQRVEQDFLRAIRMSPGRQPRPGVGAGKAYRTRSRAFNARRAARLAADRRLRRRH